MLKEVEIFWVRQSILILFIYRMFSRVFMWNFVLAHPFFISGTACPGKPSFSMSFIPSFISSPHATPTTASYL